MAGQIAGDVASVARVAVWSRIRRSGGARAPRVHSQRGPLGRRCAPSHSKGLFDLDTLSNQHARTVVDDAGIARRSAWTSRRMVSIRQRTAEKNEEVRPSLSKRELDRRVGGNRGTAVQVRDPSSRDWRPRRQKRTPARVGSLAAGWARSGGSAFSFNELDSCTRTTQHSSDCEPLRTQHQGESEEYLSAPTVVHTGTVPVDAGQDWGQHRRFETPGNSSLFAAEIERFGGTKQNL